MVGLVFFFLKVIPSKVSLFDTRPFCAVAFPGFHRGIHDGVIPSPLVEEMGFGHVAMDCRLFFHILPHRAGDQTCRG